MSFKMIYIQDFLVVCRLRLQEVWVRFPARELRACMPRGKAKKIMRDFLKDFLKTCKCVWFWLNKLQYLTPWMTFQESLG